MNRLPVITVLILFPFFTHAQFPSYVDLSDSGITKFNFFKTELRTAEIVMLGEAAHTPQYFPTKIALIKYLHEQLGYDVLAFESGLFAMHCVEEEYRGGVPSKDAFEKGLFMTWTAHEEFQKLYPYLDSLRKAGDTLIIAGFDWQTSGHYTSQRFVPTVRRVLTKNNLKVDESLLSKLQAQIESIETGRQGLTSDFSREDLNRLSILQHELEKVAEARILSQSLSGFVGHFRDLFENKLLEKLRTGQFSGLDSNPRDSAMACQLMFLREKLYPGKRIMAWGATLHFAKSTAGHDFDRADSEGFISMGEHIYGKLGKRAYLIAVSTNLNLPGTFEDELRQRKIKQAWISPSSLKGKKFSSTTLERATFGDWSKITDGIIFCTAEEEVLGNFARGVVMDAARNVGIPLASVTIEGTSRGTVCDDDGIFQLKIDSLHTQAVIKISAIGYKTYYGYAEKMLRMKVSAIKLIPEVEILSVVEVTTKGIDAKEILKEVVKRIPVNYEQGAFNMMYYSDLGVCDTIQKQNYRLETVFQTYYEGYTPSAKKLYRLTEKREHDDYFAKENTHGKAQWPMWEIASNEIYTHELDQPIFDSTRIDKIEAKFNGYKLLDADTVFVISYRYNVAGELYISAKDYAVLRHATWSSGRRYENRSESRYKKIGAHYYPYVAVGNYLHTTKVDGNPIVLKITNRVSLQRIDHEKVQHFERSYDLWKPTNIVYRQKFWDEYFPVLDEK